MTAPTCHGHGTAAILHRSVTNLVETRSGSVRRTRSRFACRPDTARSHRGTMVPAVSMRAGKVMLEPFVLGGEKKTTPETGFFFLKRGLCIGLPRRSHCTGAWPGELSSRTGRSRMMVSHFQIAVCQKSPAGGLSGQIEGPAAGRGGFVIRLLVIEKNPPANRESSVCAFQLWTCERGPASTTQVLRRLASLGRRDSSEANCRGPFRHGAYRESWTKGRELERPM